MQDLAFNQAIGELDYILSQLILISRNPNLDDINRYTLKHHAEDMVGAGKKLLANLEKTAQDRPELASPKVDAYRPVSPTREELADIDATP